jgi:hypothetical protein
MIMMMFFCASALEAQRAGTRAAAKKSENKSKQSAQFKARDVRRLMRGGGRETAHASAKRCGLLTLTAGRRARAAAAAKPLVAVANAVWHYCRRYTFVTRPARSTIDVTNMAVRKRGGDAHESWAVSRSIEQSR